MKKAAVIFVLFGSVAAVHAGPTVTLQQPPDRFFQSEAVLDVEATVDAPAERLRVSLILDGEVVAERPVSGGGVSFRVPLNRDAPVSLVQVCASRGGRRLSCDVAHAAGIREFDLLRQTLEEMNEIAIALERCSQLALGFNRVPQSLQELVPDFLAEVPHTSPLGTPYVYQAEDTHYTLRAALPGSGEVRLEDGALTRLPAGALTDRESARLTRQQLLELSLGFESYWVDFSHYPTHTEELVPFYLRRLHLSDPYGNPYQVSIQPDAYALTGLGSDGLPGGHGFAADTTVVPDRHIAETTPYRGRHEYARLTLQDMQEIAGALAYYHDLYGEWPATLDLLIGESWFTRPRSFEDFCGNPYDYQVQDAGLGHSRYVLRAYGCDGVPNTDLEEQWLYFFTANDEGYSTAPRPGWPWPGLFD